MCAKECAIYCANPNFGSDDFLELDELDAKCHLCLSALGEERRQENGIECNRISHMEYCP